MYPTRRAYVKILVLSALIFCTFLAESTQAQLTVTTGTTANNLVQNILIGQGVSAFNVQYTGASAAIGSFSNGWITNLGLDNGIILSSGDLNGVPPPGSPVTDFASSANGTGGNALLSTLIPGYTINDAAVLEFDFIPESDTIKFRYVFGSEEYPEWVNSSFNDVFGFFISGPKPFPVGGTYNNDNIALIPGTSLPVTIDNINNVTPSYPLLYVDNLGMNGLTIVYDGFTVVLTAWAIVIPCQTYHITIAVGDAGDSSYDSAVFLEEGSFSSSSVQVAVSYNNPFLSTANAVEGCQKAVINFNTPSPRFDSVWIQIDSIYGSAINGVDYYAVADSVLIPPGGTSGAIIIEPLMDNIPEGIEYVYIDVQTSICYLSDTTLIIPILDYAQIETNTTVDTTVCGEEAQLFVQPTGGAPPYTYVWSPQVGIDNPNIQNPIIQGVSDTLKFYVEVSDSTNCSIAYDSVSVVFHRRPLISFMPNIFEGCEPLEIAFTNNVYPNIQQISWDFGDGQTSTDENPFHTFYYHPDSTEGYKVSVAITTQQGCEAEYAVKHLIRVFDNPIAGFYADPDSTDLRNSEIQFNNISSSNTTGFLWDFGDSLSSENTSILENPSHTYTEAGIYNILLEVTTENGCIDTISFNVKIIEELDDSLVFPNVFTPNGDGFNDYFVIDKLESEHYLDRSFVVFDRWGKKVYEASPYMNEWGGDGIAEGTYFYIFRYEFSFLGTVIPKQISGSITILR